MSIRQLLHASWCWALLACMAPGIALAQWDESGFRLYTHRDGLSDDYVHSITQDHRGYVWIGTGNGLNRYDGAHFKKFFQGNPPGFLHSSVIDHIKPVSRNRLLIVTRNRTLLLNTDNMEVTFLNVDDTTAFSAIRNTGWDAIEVPGHGFAVTTAVGFYFFDTTGKLEFMHEAFTGMDIGQARMLFGRHMLLLPGDRVFVYIDERDQAVYDIRQKVFHRLTDCSADLLSLCHPRRSRQLIFSRQISDHEYIIVPQADSLYYYDINAQKRVASALPFDWEQNLDWSSRAILLNDTLMALTSMESGFYLFSIDRKTGRIHGDGQKYFGQYLINALFIDSEQRLWIGTDNGLLQQRLQKPFIKISSLEEPGSNSPDGPYQEVILSMLDYKGQLYIGRYVVENGILVLDPLTLEIKRKINFFPDLPGANVIRSMQVYHEDTLWVGTDQGMLWYAINSDTYGKVSVLRNNRNFSNLDVLAPVHRDGTAWACGLNRGTAGRYDVRTMRLQFYDASTSPPLPFKGTKHVVYDAYGQVWIGGHGLTRWNDQASAFDTLITTYEGPNKFNDNILIMQADSQGNLWIVNLQNGLLQYKITSRTWEHYGSIDGLPSDIIQSMSPVVDDHIWLYTPHHLSRFSVTDGSIRSFDESDGLMARHVEGKDILYHKATGYFLLPINNFIARWKMDDAPDIKSAGALICEQIDIAGKTIYFPDDAIRLGYENRDLKITYAVIDFEGAEHYQFAYRLQPSSQWTDIGSQRSISLANLSPGSYSMDFRARSTSGVEKTHRYNFSIKPPFWRTSWFMTASLIAILLIGIWLYRRRIAFISMRANIDNQLSRAEMKALHAQMNPHFIFNSLNSIRKLVLNNENHEASRYLGKFAHLIRLTLDQSRQSFVTLRQTIDYLQRYIELEKIRNPKFTCTIKADPLLDQDEIVMPPMLIQPFVENAIWHGLPADGEAIDIAVCFDREGDQMIVMVDDNGVGINSSIRERTASTHVHPAVGIDNIRSRIALLNKKHNLQSSIRLLDKSTLDHGQLTGTRVILRLPIDMHDE